jgi:hypothetical protein
VTIDGPNGPVELSVLGAQRYRVKTLKGERVADGFQRAREVGHELAAQLDSAADRFEVRS